MKKYSPSDIEPKWQEIWQETNVYTTDFSSKKPKYVGMSMFNYPSGAGIHVGHAMNYTISDVKARFKRQQGYESYHPVGWDAFGLPAENYAIKAGVSPQESMAKIIPSYHKQYQAMGWSNDWEKEISTCVPEYYKWTQWIFSKMYEHGLAYQDARMQWWCNKCQTVLANEQVTADNKCWRHEGKDDPIIQKKQIKQWFFKITEYADELLQATDDLDWTESVKLAQKNWIGRSEGAEIDFAINKDSNFIILHGFTGRADKNFIPWLKESLEALGHRVQAPQMPNTDNPKEKEQVDYVIENCDINENTVIIGHSLGGHIAMKLLQKTKQKINRLVLVAPAVIPSFRLKDSTKFDNCDFNYDYKLIKSLAKEIIILSDNQEASRRQDYLEFLSNQFGVLLQKTNANKKHFCAESEPFILSNSFNKITVFTTRADTLFGATFLVLAPEHELVSKITTKNQQKAVEDYIKQTAKKTELERQAGQDKTGVFTGAYAVNPINNQKLPIWIADYVLSGYGTGAIMAVPAHDQRDYEFAQKYNLNIVKVVDNQTSNDEFTHDAGILINSGKYNGLESSEATLKVVKDLQDKGVAKPVVNYKMRDWSVSRQRYWGAPIPIIHCQKCGIVPVPEQDLPVILPELTDFQPSGDGRSALARAKDWLVVDCPKCGGKAERETDTLDTYICSSWYMLRYLDPHNQAKIFDSKVANKWMPIDFYNGGDHATAHLLYARFVTRFFYKLGLVNNPEPFKQMLFNGKVVAKDGSPFSKTLGNGPDPLQIINSGYGADALRVYLMFAAPLELGARWDEQGVPGAYRYLNRLWTLTQEYLESKTLDDISADATKKLQFATNNLIKKATQDLENNKYNTAIASCMTQLNELYKYKVSLPFGKNPVWQSALEANIVCIAPFAPHIADELWQQLGHSSSVQKDSWPNLDTTTLSQDTVTIVVQVNGKLRGTIQMPAGSAQKDVEAGAKAHKNVASYITGDAKKIIYIKDKLLNIVV